MELHKLIKSVSFLTILVMASIPGIIGPLLNISQWGGQPTPLQDLLIVGIPTVLISVYIGYKLIFLLGIKKFQNRKPFGASLVIFIMTFIACVCAWVICQELGLIIQKLFGIGYVSQSWLDGLIGLPILIWFSIIPCLIAAFANSLVSFIFLKS